MSELKTILHELIAEGEKLAPQGGSPFQGYNGKLQPEYLAWRSSFRNAKAGWTPDEPNPA